RRELAVPGRVGLNRGMGQRTCAVSVQCRAIDGSSRGRGVAAVSTAQPFYSRGTGGPKRLAGPGGAASLAAKPKRGPCPFHFLFTSGRFNLARRAMQTESCGEPRGHHEKSG